MKGNNLTDIDNYLANSFRMLNKTAHTEKKEQIFIVE